MTDFEFDGAVSVVTGGGSGIGRSMALEFAKRGADIVVADIDARSAAQVAEEITSAGGRAVPFRVDVTDLEEVTALADAAYDTYGKVDILCNNAGVSWRPFRAVWNASLKDFRWMVEVNYFGTVNCIQAFLPKMRAQPGHKHIVNTSSMAVMRTNPGHALYTAAKSAVDGLSDVLRAELEDHEDDFGVTILYPGSISTNIGETSTAVHQQHTGEPLAGDSVIPYIQVREMVGIERAAKGPEWVGWQVAEAIMHNDPYCLTHPAPVDDLEAHLQAWVRGYRGH